MNDIYSMYPWVRFFKEVADSFLEEVKYQNVNEELLDNLITAINEAADKYTGC